MSDWRERLSNPAQPHTLPESMLLALEIAAEDAAVLDSENEQSGGALPPSARTDFKEFAGYDLYEAIIEILETLTPEVE